MKIKFLILILFIYYSNTVYSEPGSGYCLNFPNGNDYVIGTNSQLPQGNNPFTLEAWMYANSLGGSVVEFGNDGAGNTRCAMLIVANKLYFSAQGNDLIGVNDLSINQWYHLAITFDGTTLKLYVNGELESQDVRGFNITNQNFQIGVRGDLTGENINAKIDEVRIWNVGLDQTTLREYMCKKITSSHPNYANLVSYFNFDEGIGTTLTDLTGNGNGTLTNMTPSSDWQLSGAKIGNESVNTYSNQDISLGKVSVSNVSGTSPLHIYKVNEEANYTDYGNSSYYLIDDEYYGIFNDGGSTYDLEFDFGEIPQANAFLFSRDENSSQTWNNITSSTTASGSSKNISGETTQYEYSMVSDYVEPDPAYEISEDGNQDGILDVNQTNVYTFLSSNNSNYLTIIAPSGTTINNISNVSNLEENYSYPFGTTEFKIATTQAEVKIYYHGIESLDGYVYRKLFPDNTYKDFENIEFGSEVVNGNLTAFVILTLTDGGPGDYDGEVNGIIYDPGGPALPVTANIPFWDWWWIFLLFPTLIFVNYNYR